MPKAQEFAADTAANRLIEKYLNNPDRMEVDKKKVEAEHKAQDEIIWIESWDRVEHEKYFFKELMEELVHISEDQLKWKSNNMEH